MHLQIRNARQHNHILIYHLLRFPSDPKASACLGQIEFELLRKSSGELLVDDCRSATNDLLAALRQLMIKLGQNICFARRTPPTP